MSYRSRVLSQKKSKEEHELRIITNPMLDSELHVRNNDDYQAPLTAQTLSPNSKWILVRHNLHKIRSWGGLNTSHLDGPFSDWYLFFQMRRELRRFKEHIQQVEHQPNFAPIRHFYLPIDEKHTRRYNVSHVQPTDALYYPGVGEEPFVVQSLLYYFSKECTVPYNSTLRIFLTDVCSIVNQNRHYLERVAFLRKIALIMTIIVSIFIGLMLFSLIFGVMKTTSNFHKLYENDPYGGIEWQPPATTVNSF